MILNVTYQCGLRISEAVSIQAADIDQKTLTIRNAKGNKDRVVPLPDKLLYQLREYWKSHGNRALLFPKLRSRENSFDRRTTDRHIPIRTVQIAMKQAVEASGIVKKGSSKFLNQIRQSISLQIVIQLAIMIH